MSLQIFLSHTGVCLEVDPVLLNSFVSSSSGARAMEL